MHGTVKPIENSTLVIDVYSHEHETLILLEQKGPNVVNFPTSHRTPLGIMPYQVCTLVSLLESWTF